MQVWASIALVLSCCILGKPASEVGRATSSYVAYSCLILSVRGGSKTVKMLLNVDVGEGSAGLVLFASENQATK